MSGELKHAVANMRTVQLRILFIVPATASHVFHGRLSGVGHNAADCRAPSGRAHIERTRIARELHDTLLQGFISASMHVHLAMGKLPEGSPAKPQLARALEVTEKVIEEGVTRFEVFVRRRVRSRTLNGPFEFPGNWALKTKLISASLWRAVHNRCIP